MLHSFTRPCLGFACVCELLLLIPHRGNAPTERLPLVSLENNPGSHCGRTSDSNLDYSMSFKNIVQKMYWLIHWRGRTTLDKRENFYPLFDHPVACPGLEDWTWELRTQIRSPRWVAGTQMMQHLHSRATEVRSRATNQSHVHSSGTHVPYLASYPPGYMLTLSVMFFHCDKNKI